MSILYVSDIPQPVVRAGMGPGVLYNRDPVRMIYLGRDSSIIGDNDNVISILDPLSSLYVGGDVDIWMCAPTGTTVADPVPVDFIHSGRSQHYTSPGILSAALDAQLQQLLIAVGHLQQIETNTAGGGGPTVAAFAGTATLAAGTATITPGTLPGNAVVLVSYASVGANMGVLTVPSLTGASFTITSSNPADTSTVYYAVIVPAPTP